LFYEAIGRNALILSCNSFRPMGTDEVLNYELQIEMNGKSKVNSQNIENCQKSIVIELGLRVNKFIFSSYFGRPSFKLFCFKLILLKWDSLS